MMIALLTALACAGTTPATDYAMSVGESGVVIFGGATVDDKLSSDVWSWDGKAWTCVTGAGPNGPAARASAMLAYDGRRKVLVLYGGRIGREPLRDTWELSASGWSRRSTDGPTPDPHGTMAYDSPSNSLLLFHTLGDDGPGRATWKWDGAIWTKMVDGPSAEFPNAMFDGSHGSALLMTAKATATLDAFNPVLYRWLTREWSPFATSGVAPVFSPQAPAARTKSGALLFAGFEASGAVATWVLEDTAWRVYSGESPSRRRGAKMIFDAGRSVVVLHGGDDGSRYLTDTWEWDGTQWRKVS